MVANLRPCRNAVRPTPRPCGREVVGKAQFGNLRLAYHQPEAGCEIWTAFSLLMNMVYCSAGLLIAEKRAYEVALHVVVRVQGPLLPRKEAQRPELKTEASLESGLGMLEGVLKHGHVLTPSFATWTTTMTSPFRDFLTRAWWQYHLAVGTLRPPHRSR